MKRVYVKPFVGTHKVMAVQMMAVSGKVDTKNTVDKTGSLLVKDNDFWDEWDED